MSTEDIESRPSENIENDTPKLSSMPQLARVVGHYDPTFMGKLQVEVLRDVGGELTDGQVMTVDMITPFYSITGADYIGDDPDDYNNTQKAAGMWFVPPDVGSTVLVIFVNGDTKRGYWYGCVPSENTNFMVPGIAATKYVVDDTKETDPERVPVAEYNKKITATSNIDATKNFKPEHPFAKTLDAQGLLEDDVRGITTSSARREAPSAVFGWSTPGPVDKQSGAKQGPRGTKETLIPNAFVSRLGGSSFVMDDGDDKFLRRTAPTDGPPDYAAVEQDETDGDVTIPHNELVRIRTRTGHQILLHNSEDLIYITNARGTAWIELTSDGKIDIYAKDSISVRTENDFNFHADRDFNIEVGRNFNLKVAGKHQTETGASKVLIVGADNVIKVAGKNDTTSGNLFQVKSSGTNIDGGNINLNSGNFGGNNPSPLSTFDNPTEVEGETIKSIMLRVPTTEPYPHHENLDATLFKPDLTDREAGSAIEVPEYWKTYSTVTDTFAKELPPSGEEDQAEEEA